MGGCLCCSLGPHDGDGSLLSLVSANLPSKAQVYAGTTPNRPSSARTGGIVPTNTDLPVKPHLLLTDDDIRRVRQLWLSPSVDHEAMCLSVVISVLVSRPSLLRNFNLPETITAKELAECQALRGHARMIAGFFSDVLEGLSEEQRMGERMLRYVGAVHFRKGVNFTADNYLVFKQKFIEQFCAISARGCTTTGSPSQTGRAVSAIIHGNNDYDNVSLLEFPRAGHRSADGVVMKPKLKTNAFLGLVKCASSIDKHEASEFRSPIIFDEIAIHRVMNFVVKRLKEGFLHEATRGRDSVQVPTPPIIALRKTSCPMRPSSSL